ncbi:type II toxin-antitoxin system HicA family toxin [Sulfitobacter sp. G21635-S1]|jgi:hypothetical protein|uniref:type II toxin-antitoxin system HicA family toxin n=1 Tax=Sulfitobacter sp. G21635-S1 TaxID=3014043 RepID=UPI0022AFF1ED|nr:type II toxin-antitoxin system HicA family toxin [Sulfitobacter sp. G21635-S1]MCZ4254746.1 type II toxin-antitoxin system HicA family toxin [Sulfitobacter sp. G21635-S1]
MVSSKHAATLAALFQKPDRANIRWRDVEKLLLACGATLKEGAGSRIRLELNGIRMTLHKPHPKPEMDKGAVVTLRRFLQQAGVSP